MSHMCSKVYFSGVCVPPLLFNGAGIVPQLFIICKKEDQYKLVQKLLHVVHFIIYHCNCNFAQLHLHPVTPKQRLFICFDGDTKTSLITNTRQTFSLLTSFWRPTPIPYSRPKTALSAQCTHADNKHWTSSNYKKICSHIRTNDLEDTAFKY